jgi:hypothetical protein
LKVSLQIIAQLLNRYTAKRMLFIYLATLKYEDELVNDELEAM